MRAAAEINREKQTQNYPSSVPLRVTKYYFKKKGIKRVSACP